MRGLLAIVGMVCCGCGHGAKGLPRFPDAPVDFRDDNDRDQAIDRLWVGQPGAERDRLRTEVSAAIARRISDALEEDKPFVAETLVFQLTALWQADPTTAGRFLAPHVDLLRKLRTTFAKAGAVEPTLATLVLLAEIEPAQRAAHVAEIDEILSFANDLATADADSQSQPLALLQPTVLALPVPWLVDSYLARLHAFQHEVDERFKHDKSFQIVGAVHDVLQTARRMANALARAGRTGEIAAHVSAIEGLGEDRALQARAEAVATKPTADAYFELARLLRSDDHSQVPDHAASLGVALAGLEKFPTDASLLAAAAEDASALGRVEQPIALYEAALRAQGGLVDSATALRLGKLYSERIARLAFGGRPGAATTAWHDLNNYTSGAKHRAPHPVWEQVDAVAETALGRGLLSQGRMREAEAELVASLDHAPSIDAYETLTTLYWKTDRLASASRTATAGLSMLGDTAGDRYRRAKLERIAGDVMRTAGKTRDAAALYLDALRTWTSFGEDKNLPRTIAAERKLEFARGMWYLGNSDRAVDLVLEATDIAPEASSLCSEAVAFLIEVGKPTDALDAAHRGLGASGLGELDKVYISLWVLADARRRGEPGDRQAHEYLASRHGNLWYEKLAEAATGRLDFKELRAAANTGPRRTELAFYGVVLGLEPASPADRRQKLAQVVDAGLVMDAEYDLARQYLQYTVTPTLGDLLRSAGLQPRVLAAWAGTDRIPLVARRLGALGAPPPSTASAALALFVAGAEVPRHLVAPAIADSHLVAPSGSSSLLARVAIVPAGRALVVCDRADRAGDDVVCWPDDSSYHLAAALPPARVASWLDLGCGSAFAPLVHPERATRIIGSELNPRGAQLARLGAELSGIRHLTVREGDLTRGTPEQFALVTCNAPIPDHEGPMWSATTTDFVARLFDHAGRATAPDGLVVVHAALDALLPVIGALPGERVVVAYTPADGPREFGVAWWRPGADPRLVTARRSLTTARPHLDHADRDAALAGSLAPL